MHEVTTKSQIEHCTILTTLVAVFQRGRGTKLHSCIVTLFYGTHIGRSMLSPDVGIPSTGHELIRAPDAFHT
jgi:hypothetical protein